MTTPAPATGFAVRRDPISAGHLQPDGKVSGGRRRVAFENCQLCASGQKGWRRTKLNLVGGECILQRSRQRGENGGTQQNDKEHWFHGFASKRRPSYMPLPISPIL